MSKSQITKLENSQYEIIYPVEKTLWRNAQEKTFKKLSQTLEVKGFRKGHVPEAIARQNIDQMKIFDGAVGEVVNEAFQAALDEHDLKPFSQPSYDITKISDAEIEFKFIITVQPEVELGQYKGLEIGHKDVEVTPEQIDLKILELREQNAELVVKEEGEAVYGDTVVIDYKGFVDNVAFEGGEDQNFSLELGSGRFIPGFEDQLVSHQAGETFDINVTFPEEYTEELKGKDAVFKVSIHEIKEKVVPELDEDFIAELQYEGVTTEAELRDKISADLTIENTNQEKNRYLNEVLKTLRETSKIEIADSIIADEAHYQIHQFEQQLEQQGLDLATYLQFSNTDEAEFHQKYHDDAEVNIKNFLITDKIGQVEEIVITDELVDFEIAKIAMQYNMEEPRVREIFSGDDQGLERLRTEMRRTQIFDLLRDENN